MIAIKALPSQSSARSPHRPSVSARTCSHSRSDFYEDDAARARAEAEGALRRPPLRGGGSEPDGLCLLKRGVPNGARRIATGHVAPSLWKQDESVWFVFPQMPQAGRTFFTGSLLSLGTSAPVVARNAAEGEARLPTLLM